MFILDLVRIIQCLSVILQTPYQKTYIMTLVNAESYNHHPLVKMRRQLHHLAVTTRRQLNNLIVETTKLSEIKPPESQKSLSNESSQTNLSKLNELLAASLLIALLAPVLLA